MVTPARASAAVLAVLAALAASAANAGSGNVSLQPAPWSFRLTPMLGGQSTLYGLPTPWPQPNQASLNITLTVDGNGEPVAITILDAAATLLPSHQVDFSFAPWGMIPVHVAQSQLTLTASTSPIPINAAGEFLSTNLPATLNATVGFSSSGLQCGQLQSTGTPCEHEGTIGPATVPASVSGAVRRATLEPAWLIELHVSAAAPIWPADPAGGSMTLAAIFRGTFGDQTPTCPEDWNTNAEVGVDDVFAFLTDWFANDPAAQNFGGGSGVSAIFAYLIAWFAIGIGPC